jgi:hypothetical protein
MWSGVLTRSFDGELNQPRKGIKMNPQLLTAIALDRMNEVAKQAESHRRTHGISSKRNRGDRPEHRPIVARLRGQYLKRGNASNVEPIHRPSTGAC